MRHAQSTVKVWATTHKELRMLHAYTGEAMATIIARLVEAELERVRKEEQTAQTGLARG